MREAKHVAIILGVKIFKEKNYLVYIFFLLFLFMLELGPNFLYLTPLKLKTCKNKTKIYYSNYNIAFNESNGETKGRKKKKKQ